MRIAIAAVLPHGGPAAGSRHSTESMRTLNYNHLYYFWTVAREGTIARAAEVLHLTPQTISGQLGEFEVRINARLFSRNGRKLVLTDTGRIVYDYADSIFRLGNELSDILTHGLQTGSRRVNIGLADPLPSLLTYRLLQPVFELDNTGVHCRTGKIEDLLADLSVDRLDFVLAPEPLHPGGGMRVYGHNLGDSGITFFMAADLAPDYRNDFPGSLDGAPLLLPTRDQSLRRTLEQWFQISGVTPAIHGEFDTGSLPHYIGESGSGIFVAPTIIKKPIMQRYNVAAIADINDIRERYYLVSSERRLKHPAAAAIFEHARNILFSGNAEDSRRMEPVEGP